MTQRTREASEHHRRIESVLRTHYNAGREIARIAPLMPSDSVPEQVRLAQQACIGYVLDMYAGNAEAFLGDYAAGRINFIDIITHTGRRLLGFAPEKRDSQRVYG